MNCTPRTVAAVPHVSLPSVPLRSVSLAVLASALMAGCSMVPVMPERTLPVAAQWPDGAAAQTAGTPAAAPASLTWRQYFADERLQALIEAALAQNRDLRVAVLNIDQARAAWQIARADQLPTVNAALNGTRQPGSTAPYAVGTTATGGLSISAFELDLFGLVAALSEAASAQFLATEEARKTVQISLVASVAHGYYQWWADQWQLALAEQTLRTREATLKLQQLKFDQGVLNELDLRTAQSAVEQARIAVAQFRRAVQLDANAMTLLLGQPLQPQWAPLVPTLRLSTEGDAEAAAPIIDARKLWPSLSALPVGLPSEVLLKRPDIVQAEQLLKAANANIGAARAARFPRIALTASAGVASNSLEGLFTDGRTAWSFAGNLTAPIFDMGRSAANVQVSELKRDAAVAQYDKAIQTAFREVSDALVSRSTYGDQVQAQQAQVEAEAARFRLSALRYRTGVASQLDLLDAQRSLFAAQQSLISTELARQQAHIGLYKALGGGLEAPATP
ncbi:efflux transporter outer membrane subunit [Aquabacterium lacunae]|uniref:Efflux transporter outer membrane subunit n=1 Tax=Aquabacterium lacunae TaxID=2528630 RepID=A0A4Q9H3W8_9BURK|nr:efflux transporter outer membrane subunit [Aquabacterium lacunae]